MQQRKTIGERELALLSHVDERGGATVADVVNGFGEPQGLARSTVLTMMERLREKGFLGRRRVHGVYRYSTTSGPVEVMRGAVDNFVRTQLQGSVSPFVAWMSERGEVSRDELAELEALVNKLRTKTGGDA
ncbi:BlaI/MecI/CopY family transcriptional regulator [Pinirhizobacter soli]|uniref:BlaI/MecI/CopY family transcriptional regulator n=1 Tax=Pinirhizobacter soli TaxID=2786953 RepID=UPI002029FB6B|nr:BlaI/MecI/CopY family transcriptional regulator [Pinirhizobacter soli]